MSKARVGIGFDQHPFAEVDRGRVLVLGGVRFDGEAGLQGHSDADVVSHAVSDAMLGAAGLGDLGAHFPDTDPEWAGADSLAILAQVVALVAEAGLRLVNADCTVICEAPRIGARQAGEERRGGNAANARHQPGPEARQPGARPRQRRRLHAYRTPTIS